MDGDFACPECGQRFEVPLQGPGRQVRCPFCNRLLEAPYLPRFEGFWKRTSFRRPRWVAWAWGAFAIVLMAVLGFAGVQLLVKGEQRARLKAVQRLVESSREHEAQGRLDLALLDLDTALEASQSLRAEVPGDELRSRRTDLARRDAEAVLTRLADPSLPATGLGAWLNLVARAGSDRDLSPLRREVESRFLEVVGRWIDEAVAEAEREEDPRQALARYDAGADLAIHLPQPHQNEALRRLRDSVAGLISRRGVLVEAEPGEYVAGTPESYEKVFHPMAVEALAARGFLPRAASSRWKDLWASSPYRFSYAIRESREGIYLGTQNRLTRIEARLAFHAHGREIWKTSPQARTHVPVRNLSSYLASRLALSQNRNDEAEKILYDDAFSQIRDRLSFSLNTLPNATSSSAPGPS